MLEVLISDDFDASASVVVSANERSAVSTRDGRTVAFRAQRNGEIAFAAVPVQSFAGAVEDARENSGVSSRVSRWNCRAPSPNANRKMLCTS